MAFGGGVPLDVGFVSGVASVHVAFKTMRFGPFAFGSSIVNWAMSWDDYNDAVLRHPDVEAVISIAGAPGITDEDDVALPDTYPPLYVAFSPGRQPDLGPLFDEGILAVAVVRNPMPGGHKGETPREQFDATFELVTTESEELPIFQAMP